MVEATLGQIDARLTDIDDLLFRAATGQLSMEPAERERLETEAEQILQLLSVELGKRTKIDPQTIRQQRQQVRDLNFIAAVTKRHSRLHPEPNTEQDAIVAAAFEGLENGMKAQQDVARELYSIYSYMFVDDIKKTPEHQKPKALKRLLERIFRKQ